MVLGVPVFKHFKYSIFCLLIPLSLLLVTATITKQMKVFCLAWVFAVFYKMIFMQL